MTRPLLLTITRNTRLGALLGCMCLVALSTGCGESLGETPTSTQRSTATPEALPGNAATSAADQATRTIQPAPRLTQTSVSRVIDGDTIVLDGGDRVRYIGIDTPEDTAKRDCFGRQATQRNRELVEGRQVALEKDVQETDRFGRLLRYVWVDGQMVNEILVEEGFASVSTFPPDVRHQERFLEAQERARRAGAGLWGECDGDETAPGDSTDGCAPSYPDVCISPPPPYLDCSDIEFRRFRVVGDDPHEFDGNSDGEGCESP